MKPNHTRRARGASFALAMILSLALFLGFLNAWHPAFDTLSHFRVHLAVLLGGYRAGSLDRRIAALKENADADARRVIGIIQPMRDAGMTLRAIATELDKQCIETPRGGAWTAMQVKNTLDRMAKLPAPELPPQPSKAVPSAAAVPVTDAGSGRSDDGGIIQAALDRARRLRAEQAEKATKIASGPEHK